MDRERSYMILRRTSSAAAEPNEYEHLGTWEDPPDSCGHDECAAREMVKHPPRGVEWQPGDYLLIVPMRGIVPVVCVSASNPELN